MSGDDEGSSGASIGHGLRKFSNFIDGNMNAIKATGLAVGGLAVLFTFRRLHLGFTMMALLIIALIYPVCCQGTKFYEISDIPVEYFRKNVKLRGRLTQCCPHTNTLLIDHIPAISWGKTAVKPLPIELVGIDVTQSGWSWMTQSLLSRVVWFRLVERPMDASRIPIIVTCRLKYGVFRKNINLLLIERGLAQVKSKEVFQPLCLLTDNLYKQMTAAQSKAKRKGRGDWEKPSWWQRIKASLSMSSHKSSKS